ncbi:HTH-type transcriptional regulator YofA [Falsiruegeria litorea R37]|uniref:HTH-type transcriptional regulator YofA n=1 Tax=Falsiruegeria litorea R37 TaxID=1200284 RepID=A0A1Y5RXA5_9RHOB|nr:LysR family transcriptional regulator [Falsiruegeria litorea]SLN24692.1 HTH-type transcriptional regulator YofA [Falsiruegeria litorea R37]
MDIRQLKSFLTVAELGSFSAAAERLGASQSTISGHINKLEDHLQVHLFQRTTRMCEISKAGQDLIAYAKDVVYAEERLSDAFLPNRTGGSIRLGVPDDYHLLPRVAGVIQDFQLSRPRVTIQLDAGLSEHHKAALDDNRLDLAILRFPSEEKSKKTPLEARLVWIKSPDLAVDFSEDLPIAHVARPCAYFGSVRSALEQKEISWRSVFSCTTLEGVRAAVTCGMAIAAVPERDCPDASMLFQDSRLPELPVFGIECVTASDDPPMVVRQFEKLLKAELYL